MIKNDIKSKCNQERVMCGNGVVRQGGGERKCDRRIGVKNTMSVTAGNERARVISRDVAELLGVHPSTLLRRIQRGAFLEPHKDTHGYFFWYKDEVERYFKALVGKDINR